MNFNFKSASMGLVVGAGHGIGLALAERLLTEYPQVKLLATYRLNQKASGLFALQEQFPGRLAISMVDPTEEAELEGAAHWVEMKLEPNFFKGSLILKKSLRDKLLSPTNFTLCVPLINNPKISLANVPEFPASIVTL